MNFEEILKLLREYKDEIGIILTFLSIFIAFLTLFISAYLSFLSIRYAAQTLKLQREHNFKTVTPILQIITTDHEEKLVVELTNVGTGPLIIKKLIVTKDNQTKHSIIAWMPKHPNPEVIYWTTFQGGFNGLCISQGQSVNGILLEGDWKDADFVWFRNEVRKALSELTITVDYEDIYNRPMQSQTRDLKWFGRTLKTSANKELFPKPNTEKAINLPKSEF